MKEKAQVSVELMIVLLLLLGVLLFSLWAFAEKSQGLALSQESHEARLAASQIAEKANAVFVAGNGAKVAFFLKKKEGMAPSIAGNAVRVSWRENFVDSPLLTGNVTVNNLEFGKEILVENRNGEIVIDFA